MRKIVREFKEFITRGSVLDMAIGVIIATAFGKITASLVNDVFMPFVGWLIGDFDLTKLDIILREAVMDGETVVTEGVIIGIGVFISAIIDFILIALIVFAIVKATNKLKRKQEVVAEVVAELEPTNEEVLLTEIRDLLKAKNS